MTDSSAAPVAAPLADPGPPPPAPGGRSGAGDRFFSWVSGLGLARADGWIGGVCAGIAARLGIDPVIVRGVFVIAALFGLPVFLVYAAAWALLPDVLGRIHLRELLQRRFDPAMVGIGLMLLVGLFPVVPWFFAAALPFGFVLPGAWFDLTPWGVLSTLVFIALLGGVVFLIARASSRRAPMSGVSSAADPRMASAAPPTPGSPAAPMEDSGPLEPAADPAGVVGFAPPAPAGTAPLPPSADATGDELAAWRTQHEAWRAQDDAWRRQQHDAERAARDQARVERAAAGAAFAAEAAERRRIRRARNPRTSFGFVVLVIGAALVAGAVTALWHASLEPGETGTSVACGLLAAALLVGVAMIVAGAMRRRSGFLAFVAVAVLIAATITGAGNLTRGILFGGAYVNNIDTDITRFTQMWGHLNIDIAPTGEAPVPIVVDKRGGSTDIWVGQDVLLDLRVTGAADVEWARVDADTGEYLDQGTWRGKSDAAGERSVRERIDTREDAGSGTPQSVVLDQRGGAVYVTINEH
ncbi:MULTISPECIES: PspC domain-containing protein [unclassified Microbacterium]|uniref:PspC domain-containing protein n=1 Tax=unclassified Microbacterium TaxID=2609290 RepID=UPI00214AB709|nr:MULTISPECIES: PspC domain-containing protein [unclassified Microbacterium]MCR2809014.1 PspC domain-containing protein [Microbacterium sp. zg.B185]WIM18575.1 PspC domain-containing protein [Microbacterium sp. zg-B185]